MTIITSKADFDAIFKLTINGKYRSIADIGSDQKVAMVIKEVNDYLSSGQYLGCPFSPTYFMPIELDDMYIRIYFR